MESLPESLVGSRLIANLDLVDAVATSRVSSCLRNAIVRSHHWGLLAKLRYGRHNAAASYEVVSKLLSEEGLLVDALVRLESLPSSALGRGLLPSLASFAASRPHLMSLLASLAQGRTGNYPWGCETKRSRVEPFQGMLCRRGVMAYTGVLQGGGVSGDQPPPPTFSPRALPLAHHSRCVLTAASAIRSVDEWRKLLDQPGAREPSGSYSVDTNPVGLASGLVVLSEWSDPVFSATNLEAAANEVAVRTWRRLGILSDFWEGSEDSGDGDDELNENDNSDGEDYDELLSPGPSLKPTLYPSLVQHLGHSGVKEIRCKAMALGGRALISALAATLTDEMGFRGAQVRNNST